MTDCYDCGEPIEGTKVYAETDTGRTVFVCVDCYARYKKKKAEGSWDGTPQRKK